MASSILWRTNSSAIAQAFRVDDAVVADRDGVVERGAEREAGLPEPLDVAHEAEGAGPRDLAAEGAGSSIVSARRWRPMIGVVEIDLDVEPEAAS